MTYSGQRCINAKHIGVVILPVFSFNASETTSFPILQSNSDDDKTIPAPALPGSFAGWFWFLPLF